MDITVGAGTLFLLVPFFCSIPLVLIILFFLKKAKVLDIPKIYSEHTSEAGADKPDENPKPSSLFAKNKLPFTGCGFLIVCLLFLILLPFCFIMTLGAAMGGGELGEIYPYLILIGFYLNIIMIITAGISGGILLTVWIVRKFKQSKNK